MDKHFKKFIISNILLTLAIGILGAILFLTVLSDYYHRLMPAILFATLSINLIVFRILLGKKGSKFNFMQALIKSFTFKFFSYIGLVALMLILEKSKTNLIPLVLCLFFLYMLFTILEVRAFMEFARKQPK